MTALSDDALRACQVARFASALAALGLTFDLATAPVPGAHPVELGAVGLAAGIFILLSRCRDRPSLAVGTAAFLIVNLALFVALWLGAQRVAESGIPWVPFRQHHLGALTVAALAPPRLWVGLVTIAGFTVLPILQFSLFSPEIRQRMPYGDPWATLAFGGFASALLVFRLRSNRIETDVARMHAKMAALERFARTMLAVRDLMNTPLQTLQLNAELLREDRPNTKVIADRIERSVARMQEIEHVAGEYERDVAWPADAESFDPMTVLKPHTPIRR